MSDDARPVTRHPEPRYAVERFLRRMAGVPEPAMHLGLWREALTVLDADEMLDLVTGVLNAAEARQAGGPEGYLGLVRMLTADRTLPAVRALFDAAARRNVLSVLGLESSPKPPRTASDSELRPPPLSQDREITLGEKRAWARRPNRDTLDRLAFDRDPVVINNLLQNPRTTEADVLRIASRRPNDPGVLRLLFAHPRWGSRRAIQLALILNPYAPQDIPHGLLALFDQETLRTLSVDPGLAAPLRHRAMALLRQPGLPPDEPEVFDLSGAWEDEAALSDASKTPKAAEDGEGGHETAGPSPGRGPEGGEGEEP